MSDARRRALERESDPAVAAEALGARLRAGEFSPAEVGLLVYLGVAGAAELADQLDPTLVPRRTWSDEVGELALLSLAPQPGRFCFEAWPDHLAHAARRGLVGAAALTEVEAVRQDPDFPARVSESLVNAVTDEAIGRGLEDPGGQTRGAVDLVEALVILRDAPGWRARGGLVPLELQVFPPLCRILGVEEVEALVRDSLLERVLGAEL